MRIPPLRAARLAARWGVRRLRRARRAHGFILMYHRVAEVGLDPWHLCVSPDRFAAQLRELCAMADPVPLEQLPSALRRGRRARPVFAVTFDDGYLDNLTAARPLLAEHGVPATVFVATDLIGSGRAYWWDRLAQAVLGARSLPRRIVLNVGETAFEWEDAGLSDEGGAGRQARERLHTALWSRLRLLDDGQRDAALGQLMQVPGASAGIAADTRAMDVDELRRLASDPLVTIGAHTLTHPVLPALGRDEKVRQVQGSAARCRALTGESPRVFAYPYGDLDDESVEVVRDAGFALACSTREDLVWEGDDLLQLPRIAVDNWSGEAFRQRLVRYWLP